MTRQFTLAGCCWLLLGAASALAQDVDEKLSLKGPARDEIYAIAFSPDNKLVAASYADGTIQIWDAASGDKTVMLRAGRGLWSLAFSPNSKKLAICGGERGSIQLWDTSGEQLWAEKDVTGRGGVQILYAEDGKTLICPSASDFKTALTVWNADTGQPIRDLSAPDAPQVFHALALSPDGKTVAGAALKERGDPPRSDVRLWEYKSGKMLRKLPEVPGQVIAVAFAAKGKTLVIASTLEVRTWDIEAAEWKQSFKPRRPGQMAASPKSGWIALIRDVDSVGLWDGRSDDLQQTWKPFFAPATALAFSPDGTTLATGGREGFLKLWTVPKMK
jgi:Tol biopolymer transport system component